MYSKFTLFKSLFSCFLPHADRPGKLRSYWVSAIIDNQENRVTEMNIANFMLQKTGGRNNV